MRASTWVLSAVVATGFTVAAIGLTDTADIAMKRAGSSAASTATMSAKAPAAASSAPVVVEFFTSQGCSSCPPSDRLAEKLAKDASLLVIQRPVTYWDRLGWKDTLGSPRNTNLQRAYARRSLSGRNGVYTPQAVVSGKAGVVGSREADLLQLVAIARMAETPQVKIASKPDGSAEIMVSGAMSKRAQVQLVGLDSSETVRIGRGENGGRTLRYTNIWKGEQTLGTLVGGEASFMIDASDRTIRGANAYAVIIREGTSGPILAGRMLPKA